MIIKELYELYGRLRDAGENVPQKGRKLQKISFRIILNMDKGENLKLRVETNLGDDKKVPSLMVLGEKDHSSKTEPFFLFDKAEYMLGYGVGSEKYFPAFKNRHLGVEKEINCPQYSDVCRFLEQWNPNTEENKQELEKYKKLFSKGNGVFEIEGEHKYVHELEPVQRWWDNGGKEVWQNEEKRRGQCLVSGEENAIIARLHEPCINDIASLGIDAQSKAVVVSFKEDAFCSYGEEKGYNAPVSKDVVFKYCNAIKYLISHDENRVIFWEKVKEGKNKPKATIVVFWSDAPRGKDEGLERLVGACLESKKSQNFELNNKLKTSLQELSQGQEISNAFASLPDTRFFVLGITPNGARISIRFWKESTIGDFIEKLRVHYEALKLNSSSNNEQKEAIITPHRILQESVRRYKIEDGKRKPIDGDIRSHDVGTLMNSIIQGTPYPDTIAIAILNRIKADGNKVTNESNHVRCSYLKAWLSRKKTSPIQIQYMLNEKETNPAYLFGRLFAVLEKTQEEAAKGETKKKLDRTVKDSFYASASVTPDVVFPRMIRLNMFHLSKLKKQEGKVGLANHYEELIRRILNNMEMHPNPRVLNLMEQGIFALGYYHQKQDFYKKKDTETEKNEEE